MSAPLLARPAEGFAVSTDVIVVGGGACGLTAALSAQGTGCDVIVLERDALPAGSTSLSSGFIPACGTRWQRAHGVQDDVATMAADIQHKNGESGDPAVVDAVCAVSGPTLEWLADAHGLAFELLEGFLYPGHTRLRMHSLAARTGRALEDALLAAAGRTDIELVTEARVVALYVDAAQRIHGVRFERPDGTAEDIGCRALVLACCGFGGNRELVARHIPEIKDALYFGHPGNVGDALLWGQALGAATRHLSGYQGHGSVAHPHGIPITWAIMMSGGIQVNLHGVRFTSEHRGYSEQAVAVLEQPERVAWDIFDERILAFGRTFPDFVDAENAGALRKGATAEELAAALGLPPDALARTIAATQGYAAGRGSDPYGRDFTTNPPLAPPYYAIRVTGALFHTQGGLAVDAKARVVGPQGRPLPNLLAGGGAACGLSGPRVEGYLSGNGLLSAVMLGRLAGLSASEIVRT